MPSLKKNKPGITLIELLIVTVLLCVISFTLYATFSNGIKIWQRVNQEILEEDIDIFFEKFSTDLRKSFNFTSIHFSGDEEKIEFATVVESQRLKHRSVGKVIYFYDSSLKAIGRKQLDFSQISDNDERDMVVQLLKDVVSLKFQYYLYDNQSKEYLWQDKWEREKLPLAVRIELELGNVGQINKITRTVAIPVND